MLQVREEYGAELERAQSRVAQQEQLHQQMTQEMAKLRDTLKQMGKDVPETKFEMPAVTVNGVGKKEQEEEPEEEEGQEDIEVDEEVEETEEGVEGSTVDTATATHK